MMTRSLKERLAALERSVRGPTTRPAESDQAPAVSTQQGDPAAAALTALGFTQLTAADGPVWVRTLRYDLLTRHGERRFGDVWACDRSGLERLSGRALQPEGLRFYDTETTGLGTGAGTFAFLHAVGWLEDDELVIEQYFVADFTTEAAVLRALHDRRLRTAGAIVSFNGKSFDWPLLKSRMALHRIGPAADIAHLDLLHPARRLWRSRLPRVSLQAVEEHILGLRRQDDLPGREAPNRYFAFLSDPHPDLLEPVFAHNASDVCSLVVLTAKLADVLSGRECVESAAEYTALARLYDEWQAYDLAERCFTAAVSCPDADWKAHWLRSLHFKRRGEWDLAVAAWEEMLERFPWAVGPAVELAKYAEHRVKDLEAARRWAQQALDRALARARDLRRMSVLQASNRTGADGGSVADDAAVAAIRRRIERIERKRRAIARE